MIARIDGCEIAYDDVGRGPAVVFLHGFPLDRTMWAAQTGALSGEHRCVAIDFRGFGDSTAAPPYGMDRYADDIVAVLDTARIDRATIVGLSMGGYVAFALWRRHRERMGALVLADSRAAPDTPDTRERRHELIALARADGVGVVAERQSVGLLGKTTRERRPDVVKTVHGIMARARVDGIVGALEAMLERPDSTPTLGTISIPTLVVVGDEDVVTPAKEARAMHEAIAGSRFEILAGAGHLSNIERPASFNAVLNEFLLTVDSSAPRPV